MDEHLSHFAALAETAAPDALFGELHRMCDAAVGVTLFTCSRFDLEVGQAERIYTSDPAAYPLTGLKDIVPNRWTKTVLDGRQPFLSETIEGLRDVFPDHEKIEGLGLGAAINLPAFVNGKLLGTVNLLAPDHVYSNDALGRLEPLTICVSLAFLAYTLEATRPAKALA